MRSEAVYLKIDRHIELKNPKVCIGDLGGVCCSNKQLAEAIKNTVIFEFPITDNGKKKTASAMVVIDKITNIFDNEIAYVQNIGENEFAMNLSFMGNQKTWALPYKVIMVGLITFFGSVFAIMTYNEDVGTTGVFEKIAAIMGTGQEGINVMAVAYGIGIAIGIIIFFNHFGRKKLTNDPTPMEVEMEKYEADVEDTLIKEAARRGENFDID